MSLKAQLMSVCCHRMHQCLPTHQPSLVHHQPQWISMTIHMRLHRMVWGGLHLQRGAQGPPPQGVWGILSLWYQQPCACSSWVSSTKIRQVSRVTMATPSTGWPTQPWVPVLGVGLTVGTDALERSRWKHSYPHQRAWSVLSEVVWGPQQVLGTSKLLNWLWSYNSGSQATHVIQPVACSGSAAFSHSYQHTPAACDHSLQWRLIPYTEIQSNLTKSHTNPGRTPQASAEMQQQRCMVRSPMTKTSLFFTKYTAEYLSLHYDELA